MKLTVALQAVDFSQIAFQAVFVFHDSRDWGFDTQIMTDVLASPDGTVGTWKDLDGDAELWKKQLPVFFSNPDLLWVRDFRTRFANCRKARSEMSVLLREMTGRSPGTGREHSKKLFGQCGSGRPDTSCKPQQVASRKDPRS